MLTQPVVVTKSRTHLPLTSTMSTASGTFSRLKVPPTKVDNTSVIDRSFLDVIFKDYNAPVNILNFADWLQVS